MSHQASWAGSHAPTRLASSVGRIGKRVIAVLFLLGLGVAGLMYERGYLVYDGLGLGVNSTPAFATPAGLAYRKFDMNMEFKDRSIWTKPEAVLPNSFIEAGPIWGANLICPKGNFTIKGDLRNARITVPDGTLTIEGDVLDSYISARHVVIRGLVARTSESGTQMDNHGATGPGDRLFQIAANQPIVGLKM